MLRLAGLALVLSFAACSKGDKSITTDGTSSKKMGEIKLSKASADEAQNAVSGKKLNAKAAKDALMVPPTEKNMPPVGGAAADHFPEGSADDPAVKKGGVLSAAQRRCVDTCFNRLDVDAVCTKRVPMPKDQTKLDGYKSQLRDCIKGARQFCGVRCGTATPPKRPNTEPLPEPKAVTKAEAPARLGVKLGEKIFVTFKTTLGDIVAELYWEKVPNTVTNFVELAEGKRSFIDPKADPKLKSVVKRAYYDGLIFHRVIPNFMIQAGCPQGTGMGGPGYNFADEFDVSLKHEGPGMLSMANSGPSTNGSQFFITEKTTKHLDGRHTVFGKVVSGLDIQKKIANVETAARNMPKVPVVMTKVLIGRGTPAK
jgi:cyclophilin family peptidyl-prolyl cis-trans isomerase